METLLKHPSLNSLTKVMINFIKKLFLVIFLAIMFTIEVLLTFELVWINKSQIKHKKI